MSTLMQEWRRTVASRRDELEHGRQAFDSRQLRHEDQQRPTRHG